MYQMMCKILKQCINKYVLTNNVLQEACDTAKGDLFGDPDENVKYAYAIANAIQQMGHTIDNHQPMYNNDNSQCNCLEGGNGQEEGCQVRHV
jgi:hypothetical protein